MRKDAGKLFTLVAITIAIVGGLSLYAGQTGTPQATDAQMRSATVSLSVQGLFSERRVTVSPDETVLSMLTVLNAEDARLQLSTKNYPGMGILVVGMGGMKNGTDNKYWQYTINGVMPQIGADAYTLKPGDSVAWFFGTSLE